MLLHAPRVLLHLSPSLLPYNHLPGIPSSSIGLCLRRSTALRAEPAPSSAAAEPPDDGGGPIELRSPTLFAVDDNPTPLQVATSVLLTGAISVFLFRSLRRRARRAKELRVRSSGMNKPKDLREEALESLKAIGAAPVEAEKPPSPVQAFLAGIAAGVIALILYKFTTTIEASLNRQTISDNFSLTFASIVGNDSSKAPSQKNSEQSNTMASSSSSTSNVESASSDLQQISDKSKNSTE